MASANGGCESAGGGPKAKNSYMIVDRKKHEHHVESLSLIC